MADNVEHERKFIVSDVALVRKLVESDSNTSHMVQGYLLDRNGISVRARLTNNAGSFTLKGPRVGAKRVEHEQDISAEMADLLLHACEGLLIRKMRFPIVDNELTWTIDVFLDDNEGLVLAEIEDPPENLEMPTWCSMEVTEDDRFYNLSLSRVPFSQWSDRVRFALDWRPEP